MAETTQEAANARRSYNRRSDDQRIADLEARIAELKKKAAARETKNDPVVKDIPRVQRRLRKFAQLAIDHDRMDLSNSTMAFVAQLERIRTSELAKDRSRVRGQEEEFEEDEL